MWPKNYAKKAKPKTNKDFRYPGNENSNQTKFPVLIVIYSSTVTVTEFSKHNAREITLRTERIHMSIHIHMLCIQHWVQSLVPRKE